MSEFHASDHAHALVAHALAMGAHHDFAKALVDALLEAGVVTAALPADPQPAPSEVDFGAVADVLEAVVADGECLGYSAMVVEATPADVVGFGDWLRTQATRLRALGGAS